MFTWAQVMVEEERYRDRVRKAERKQSRPMAANRGAENGCLPAQTSPAATETAQPMVASLKQA